MTKEIVPFELDGIISGVNDRGPVIISHGAGRGMDAAILEKTASRLADLGFIVLRYNFSYIGKKPAPSAGGKNEKPELVHAIEFMKQFGKPILIGKSFGARVGSYVAAERDDIKALAFYGMPLVGMSAKSKPRDWTHLGNIRVPMLFITGDKDKLCPLDRLAEVQKIIRAPLISEVVPGDHSFKPKSEDRAIEICVDWINKLD
jgi:predicted alpha/beta-hydrolase family hydrolase